MDEKVAGLALGCKGEMAGIWVCRAGCKNANWYCVTGITGVPGITGIRVVSPEFVEKRFGASPVAARIPKRSLA